MTGQTGGKAPIRLLHMHGSFSLGGKEARTVRLMNAFGDEASHVVLSADPDALSAAKAIDRRINAVIQPDDAPLLAGKPGLRRYRQLAEYFTRFDLLLSYNWGAMDGVMAHCLFSNMQTLPPLIHHEDGFNADERVRRKKKRDLFRMVALARANALVVPSSTLEEVAKKGWHQPESRVVRIANGIDVERYGGAASRKRLKGLNRREGEIVVGTLAALRPVKNIPLLVRAVADAGDNVRLAVVGEGPERDNIVAEAERSGIADRLSLTGFYKNPREIIGNFDIFALSSDSEQAPISLIEAMAAGLPVAATSVGDVADMVSAANRPYIVAAGDQAALARAIAELAGDADLRSRIGEANRAKAAAEFNEERMILRYRRLYGHAAGREDFYATARS